MPNPVLTYVGCEQAITRAMKDTHTTQQELAEKLNVCQQNISKVIHRDNRTSTLISYLDTMGYDVCVTKRDGSQIWVLVPPGQEVPDVEIGKHKSPQKVAKPTK